MENSGQSQRQDPGEEAIRRLQSELDGSEMRFRTIVDAVPQIIWENDPDGKAIYFNRRWYEYSGLSVEESTGPGWPVLHPEDRHAVDDWQQSLLSGQPFESEGRLRRADGVYEWHLLRNLPLRDKDGAICGWFGTATNIHELKNMGFLLHQTSERLYAILEAATDFAIITTDKEGSIIDWNSGAQRMFGYERREAIGKQVELIFTPEDRYAGIPGQEIARAGETGQSMDERWHMRKDGSRFFVSGVMTPIRARTINGYVKVARDITDRKLTEEALFLAEQRNSVTLQMTKMGEWDWDIVSDQVTRNEYAKKLFGLDAGSGDSNNRSFFAFVYPADAEMVRQQVQTALAGLNIYQAEFRILRADNGRVTWVSSYGRVVRHTHNFPSRMIGVIYDITARKTLEKHKDDFISVASHELKTPVTSIKGYSQVLLANFRQANDTTNAALLSKLNGQVDRLTNLLHTLLDSTSILEGKLSLRPEVFDLNKLVEEQVAEIQLIAPLHRLVWRPAVRPFIHADRGRIRQVVTNLLSNAIKYSPKDSEIIISSRDEMDGALIEVQDFGAGIPPDQQPHIFQRYYRANDGNLPNTQSLGLGLYISLEIIKQHKGSMGVESIYGKGSTFYFKLSYS
jgi:hypothetical protein